MGTRTEEDHSAGARLDQLSGLELAQIFAEANFEVAAAVAAASASIGEAIEAGATALRAGGRLIFGGAGTSGRLAVLEAAECPPTFDTAPEQVLALLAGGAPAFLAAVEGAEDDEGAGARTAAALGALDLVIGISASGRAPWLRGLLAAARTKGCLTFLVTSNPEAPAIADRTIVLDTGPELLAGSTRLKAATAAKCALNAITTGTFARLGRVYGNLMVEVRPTNAKLRDRAARIVARLGGVALPRAEELLAASGADLKVAIVRARMGIDDPAARRLLAACGRDLRELIG